MVKMTWLRASLLGLMAVLFAGNVGSQEISSLQRNVVYLTGKGPVVQRVNNREVEVWFRDPLKAQPEPLEIVGHSGTGFFVDDNGVTFLVTAQHVAQRVSQNPQIALSSQDGRSFSLALDQIVTNKPLSWTSHKHADVAVVKVDIPKDIPGRISLVSIQQLEKGGIHLTQATPTHSVASYGEALGADGGRGLSADIPGVSGLVSR